METLRQKQIERAERLDALVPIARSAANVLTDVGHASTARALEEALLQIDALQQEIETITRENAPALLNEIRMRPRP